MHKFKSVRRKSEPKHLHHEADTDWESKLLAELECLHVVALSLGRRERLEPKLHLSQGLYPVTLSTLRNEPYYLVATTRSSYYTYQ